MSINETFQHVFGSQITDEKEAPDLATLRTGAYKGTPKGRTDEPPQIPERLSPSGHQTALRGCAPAR